jgi:hypothetical protein
MYEKMKPKDDVKILKRAVYFSNSNIITRYGFIPSIYHTLSKLLKA